MLYILQVVLRIFFVVIISSSYATASASVDNQYRTARDGYVQLQKNVAKQQYRHNWERVIKKLRFFSANHPDHAKAAAAHYLCGKANRQLYEVSRVKKDAQAAIDSFAKLAEKYPDSSLADDALYLQAEIAFNITHQLNFARSVCAQLIKRYPHGDMIGKARQLWKKLPPPVVSKKNNSGKRNKSKKKVKAGKSEITQIRFQGDAQHTRIVVELSAQATYKVNTLAFSQKNNALARIYFDIMGAHKGADVAASQAVNKGVVKKIRVGENGKYTRVVCDLKYLTSHKVFELSNPFRIVVDIANKKGVVLKADIPQLQAMPDAEGNKAGHRAIAAVMDKVPNKQQPMRVNIPDVVPKKGSKIRIVVDAGHGGKDPGAIGYSKLYEKKITLKIAKLLSARLKKDLNCEVLMTRKTDVFIPLRQRTAYANKVNADLFISIHANSSNNKKAYGIETFYLNFSKNDKAVAVAARENGMSLKEVGDLELILFDLMANSKINESSRLASDIQSSLVSKLKSKYSKIKDHGVRQGPFHVLLGATMPSVLVEVAFISNKREAKRLKSRAYCERTAEAIAKGIKHYLQAQNLL